MNMLVTDTVDTLPSAHPTLPDRIRGLSTRLRLILGVLAVLLLAAVAWAIFAPSAAPKKKPVPPVIVHTATQADIKVVEHTIGTIISPATVQITAQVQGQLIKSYFTEGQMVQQGQLLFQIDPKPYQAALDSAMATMADDKAKADRYAKLLAANAVSPQDADDARAGYLTAKAAAETARINLGYTKIYSPIEGKTGPIMIQPGNQVMASAGAASGAVAASTGATTLVTVTQLHPIKVSFALPQSDLPRIQARMASHDLTVDLGNKHTAPVDFVSNQVNPQTGTIELRATFPNIDNALVPGQLLDTGVVLDVIKGATVVPHDAVNAGLDSSYVYVVRDGNAVMVKVKVLNDNGTVAAVQGALKPGEKVITDGQMRVVAGKPVTISGKPQDKNIGK
jgi:membrane fusion protein, multidrug efflux system